MAGGEHRKVGGFVLAGRQLVIALALGLKALVGEKAHVEWGREKAVGK